MLSGACKLIVTLVNGCFLFLVPAAETRLHHELQHHASHRQTGAVWNQGPLVLLPSHCQDLVRGSVRLCSHSAHSDLHSFCWLQPWKPHTAASVSTLSFFLSTDTLMAYWNKISPQDIMNFLSLLEWVEAKPLHACFQELKSLNRMQTAPHMLSFLTLQNLSGSVPLHWKAEHRQVGLENRALIYYVSYLRNLSTFEIWNPPKLSSVSRCVCSFETLAWLSTHPHKYSLFDNNLFLCWSFIWH